MADPYTYVAKPTSSVYTYLNPQGREQYDQQSITYDDPNVFYDGVNQSQWSSINKPTSSVWTNVAKPA